MKISIEVKDNIYYVTKNPNFFQKLFGCKEKVERYKTNGDVFHYFDHIKVFYRSDGELLLAWDKMSKILNNYTNSF